MVHRDKDNKSGFVETGLEYYVMPALKLPVTISELLTILLRDFLPSEALDHLCHIPTEGQYLAPSLGVLQKVRPILHHFGARLQVEGVIVRGAHGVARRVG